jgi:hypothetical protein
MGKKHKKSKKKKSSQIALLSSKTATESVKPLKTLFVLIFQSCVKSRLYKLGCQCMAALLTDTETKAKRPKVKAKQKIVQNSLHIGIFKLENKNGSRSSQGLPTMVGHMLQI